MTIILNGEKKDIPSGLTVRALLEHLDIKPERVAVEINEEIVRKATYAEVPVRENDRVEVVQFMGGGFFECGVRNAECGMKGKGHEIFLTLAL